MQSHQIQLNPMQFDKVAQTIRASTEELFATMLGLPLDSGTAYREKADTSSFSGVVGLIGLAGSCAGAGRLSCTAAFACRLSSALLATECSTIDNDVLDAIAEVTNIIIGNVKSRLEEDLGAMKLSMPTVIFGGNYEARGLGASEWTVVPFLSGGERMDIKLCLVPGAALAEPIRELAGHRAW